MMKSPMKYPVLWMLQRGLWYLFVAAFAVLTVLLAVEHSLAHTVAEWTVAGLIVATGAKLIFIALNYSRRRQYGYVVLTALLLLVLAGAALWKAFH